MNYPKISQTIEPESLEVRKEIALSVAKECIELLKENYAVTEVRNENLRTLASVK